MDLLNALSVPRGLATFPRKWLKANCQTSDNVGDCVYITGGMVGEFYQVTKVDPADQSKMPAVGIITSKKGPTECRVQFLGEIKNIYSLMTPGKLLFIGSDGRLNETPPLPLPSGYVFVQPMAVVASSTVLVVAPALLLTKRVG